MAPSSGEITTTDSVVEVARAGEQRGTPAPTPDAGPATRRRRADVLTAAALLASPLLLIWPLRARIFGAADMIDNYLSTAVVQHGRDLVDRFGSDRQITRAGFAVPARVLNVMFGDIGGYLAWRYVLVLVAIIPAFVLFTRLRGRAAGAVAAAALLASPVVVKVWSTDFPIASVASYLAAGYCCLLMPEPRRPVKLVWIGAGGAFLSLALYSHAIALFVVACALVTFGISRVRQRWQDLVVELGVLAGAFVVASVAMSAGSALLFGAGDIWGPTFDTVDTLRETSASETFHSSNWRWLLDTPQVLVPIFVALVWGLLALRRNNGFTAAERVLAATLVLQFAVLVFVQFGRDGWVVEFHYYFAMVWPTVALVAASTACELGRALQHRGAWRWLPAVLVFGVPLLISTFTDPRDIRFVTAGIVCLVAAIGIFALGRLRHPVRAVGALVAFLTVAYVVTVGQPLTTKLREGQAILPNPQYALVFANPDASERDYYAIAGELDGVVPSPPAGGAPLLLWGPKTWSTTLNRVAAGYGWKRHSLVGMPTLSDADVARLDAERPDVVVLLSDDGSEFPAALASLQAVLPDARVTRSETLEHGPLELHVDIVETGFGAADSGT